MTTLPGRIFDGGWLEQGVPAVHEGRRQAGDGGGADLVGLVLRCQVKIIL